MLALGDDFAVEVIVGHHGHVAHFVDEAAVGVQF
jgi:hypothetical protein